MWIILIKRHHLGGLMLHILMQCSTYNFTALLLASIGLSSLQYLEIIGNVSKSDGCVFLLGRIIWAA